MSDGLTNNGGCGQRCINSEGSSFWIVMREIVLVSSQLDGVTRFMGNDTGL